MSRDGLSGKPSEFGHFPSAEEMVTELSNQLTAAEARIKELEDNIAFEETLTRDYAMKAESEIAKLREQRTALNKRIEVAEARIAQLKAALEGSLYELGRIQIADWTADQMRAAAEAGVWRVKEAMRMR